MSKQPNAKDTAIMVDSINSYLSVNPDLVPVVYALLLSLDDLLTLRTTGTAH